MGILDSLSKNPSAIALAALGIGLFIFRDKISGFFSDITGGAKTANILGENLLSNLQGTQDLLNNITGLFTNFKFPEIPNPFENFEFPTFEFPDFKFPDLPEFPSFPTPEVPSERMDVPFDVPGREDLPPIDIVPGFGRDDPRRPSRRPIIAEIEARDLSVPSPFQDQTFMGGGVSFEGGQIFETPIENLSLSQIIDRFKVTASQAADIRARAGDDFGDFDFGTNTGTGIGSVFADPTFQTGFPSQGAVSNEQFQGLSAQEIFLRLVGGNISNF